MTLYVNADWSALVPEGSPEAAFGVQAKDLKRLGLDHLAEGDVPKQAEPEVLHSANAEPTPELTADVEKAVAKPSDKAVRKPANKGSARKDSDGNGD